jgi:hypothetical protein
LIGWGRKRRSRWVVLVLPGLLLRAMIPLGFMPMFGPGLSVQLMLCEGYAPVPSTAAQMSMDMAMDLRMPMDMPMGVSAPAHTGGPDSTSGGSPSHQDHSSCSYGAGPTLAALTRFSDVPISIQPTAQLPTRAPQVAHPEVAPRAQSPRGPPLKV